jgi:bifunctional non-homologous end joining protein LigD
MKATGMFPSNLRPMPLKRHRDPFSNPDWFFELKHDGFRALALIERGRCRLVSRNGNNFSAFAGLSDAIPKELNTDAAVLDGEIVCLDGSGKSQFNELLFRRGEPRFYAFDLLWCEGKDLRFDGLHERKRQLRALISKRGHLLYCDHIEQHGERLFEFVCANDLEGIVCKPKNSPYQFTETKTYWLKLKNREYTQALGREDLFARGTKKPAQPDWNGCTIACAELEL